MSEEWEHTYQSGAHNNKWPWSDLISNYFRYRSDLLTSTQGDLSVYEYGCGTGNNYPFFEDLGLEYGAIEQSEYAVGLMLERFPKLASKVSVGSFVDFEPQTESADFIVDSAAITHCNFTEISKSISNVWRQLKPGGIYLGLDWFSTDHSDFLQVRNGNPFDGDVNNIPSGQFAGLGKVHFTHRDELRNLFGQFQMLHLSHKVISNANSDAVFASWSLVARKPV